MGLKESEEAGPLPIITYFANLIWQIADLLRGPYRPPQYERVMLPMTVLRRFDCVLAPTKAKVLAEYERRKGGKLKGDALDTRLNKAAGQRFHNHSPLDFEKLKGDPDNIEKHLVSYIKGFSANVRAHLRVLRVRERDREDARGEHPLPRRLQVLRRGPAPERSAERADGAHLREPHPPLQRTGQRDRGRPLHAARSHPADGEHPVHPRRQAARHARHRAQAARPGLRHRRHAGRGAELPARAPRRGASSTSTARTTTSAPSPPRRPTC